MPCCIKAGCQYHFLKIKLVWAGIFCFLRELFTSINYIVLFKCFLTMRQSCVCTDVTDISEKCEYDAITTNLSQFLIFSFSFQMGECFSNHSMIIPATQTSECCNLTLHYQMKKQQKRCFLSIYNGVIYTTLAHHQTPRKSWWNHETFENVNCKVSIHKTCGYMVGEHRVQQGWATRIWLPDGY